MAEKKLKRTIERICKFYKEHIGLSIVLTLLLVYFILLYVARFMGFR